MSSQTGTGTSEVSKKLKLQAAIRAKLEELGVYVDDELPDYIMVMIANKKEKVQMKEDLNLFIGKSTGKFVDWLFDLFDRLQNASNKQGETSKKEDDTKKEQEAKEQEEKRRKEKEEREQEQLKEKERERERVERQKERDRAKRVEEEKRREEKRKEIQRNKHRRSRSNTYSDDEEKFSRNDRHHKDSRDRRTRSGDRKSSSNRQHSASPEKKVQSTVVVKRNIRPTGDTNVRGRGTMFLRAMNEASVSAGYGSSKTEAIPENNRDDDDMSDVEALPSKSVRSPKKSVHERLSRVDKKVEPMDDDTVVLGNQPPSGGPQMILKLTGGKDAIKKTRIQDRIVVPDSNLRRGLLKRRVGDTGASEEPKSKHERIVFNVSKSRDSTPSDDSPTMQKWNGQIEIGDSDESGDEEAEIDAFVAEARGIGRRESVMEEDEIPPTHQLSGATYAVHVPQAYSTNVPTYIPTPLSVLNEQQNQMGTGVAKDHHVKERCVFWPKCTKGDACAFMHPTTNCKNFPNCTFGIRCLFIHPPCRFDRFCTKKHCPFTHHGTGGVQPGAAPEIKNPLTSNRISTESTTNTLEELPKPTVRGTLGSLAEKLAASIKKKPVVHTEKKEDEKTDENETANPEKIDETKETSSTATLAKSLQESTAINAPLQSMIPCRYAGGCRNPVCHFKHPKECRFGSNCRNPSCYFYHKPTNAPSAPVATPAPTEAGTAKYKWTAAN